MLLLAVAAVGLVLEPPVFLAGGLAASLGHTVAVPIDVIKTKQQNEAERYGANVVGTAAAVVSEEGAGALFLGLDATLYGYLIHGGLKYGLYDAFKPDVAQLLPDAAPPIAGLALAAVLAECISSTALCPLEAARIRAVSDPEYAGASLPSALLQLTSTERGVSAAFDGLPPILLKQIPYTACQLATYETARTALVVPPEWDFAAQLSSATLAAVFSSLASQPGDSLLSEVNRASAGGSGDGAAADGADGDAAAAAPPGKAAAAAEEEEGLLATAARLGPEGLFRGTSARLLQMIVIVVVQLLANDAIRSACGLGPMGQ